MAILLLLESRGKLRASELASALETSVRSIYRDIDVLSESGIPLLSTPGPNGGISLMEGYTVNLKQLHGDDVIQLYLTGMGIYSGGGSDSALRLKNALLKLEKTLPHAYQSDISKAKKRFLFDETPWWSERPAVPFLEEIRTALWRTETIKVTYCKVTRDCSTRTLEPYGLVVKQMDWYLIAYCHEAGDIRTFKCERIQSVVHLSEFYEIPATFSLEQYWRSQQLIFKQSRREEEMYPVVIRADKNYENMLQTLEVLELSDDGEGFRATINMYSYEDACKLIAPIFGQAEIIGPEEMRFFAKERLLYLSQLYN
ncbi:helix-turn-helix transcriptional regulator [Paenibacillus sp. sgz500958]|uniref:helix-turn-helix transcriptional regulator n=1 Tax=Paenibacillus sp. sgz500958 TaxID=3242475 RepID=UPI0036D239EF